MALARVVSFDGVNSDRMAALKSEIEGGEQPEGMNATEMLLLHDPSADQALAIVFFAERPTKKAAASLADADHSPDRAVVAGRDVYVRYPAGVQGSRLSAAKLERLLEVPGTHRNWRTVAALAQLAAEA